MRNTQTYASALRQRSPTDLSPSHPLALGRARPPPSRNLSALLWITFLPPPSPRHRRYPPSRTPSSHTHEAYLQLASRTRPPSSHRLALHQPGYTRDLHLEALKGSAVTSPTHKTATISSLISSTMASRRRAAKKGVSFCLMVVGASGTGKTTFVNTLCESEVIGHKISDNPETAHIEEGIRIKPVHVELEEDGMRIGLTIVDTPGFGDNIDNEYA